MRVVRRAAAALLSSVLVPMGLLVAVWAALQPASIAQAQGTPPSVIINELHYKPDVETEQVEFIELYNPGNNPIDLSGWALEDAVDYFFPDNTILEPGDYVVIAENPGEFRRKFGFEPLGPFGGKLSSDGETLTVRSRSATNVDEVEFQLGFPWPTTGYSPGYSIQLVNAAFDNGEPGNWRSAAPTPGRANDVRLDNAPPSITDVNHSPQTPTSGQEVVVTARVVDPDGVAGVSLDYQVVTPGNYLALSDDAYWQTWTRVPMYPQGNDLYQAVLPASLQQHRNLVRYRVAAGDNNLSVVIVPYADDLQPNFAYFVYDGVPTWTASPSGGPQDMTTFDFDAMDPLPVYHFIAKEWDIADAMFMPPSGWAQGYMGSDYLWRGTMVYNGEVYDHVQFRARGGMHRYATGKTFWKVNFNLGHRFQAYDNYGRPYPATWDKLNLSSGMQHSSRRYRGEQGMFESLSFRLFNLAGVAASDTHFIHWRVIDNASEQGGNQYDGDFWGLYLAIEQVDGHFLDQHDLPDGNLYKIDVGVNDLQNQGADAVTDHSDLAAFMNTYTFGGSSQQWWRDNFDLEWFYSYRSIVEAVRHYDINHGKNYHYFNNPELNKWQVIPWDVDITWSQIVAGVGDDPFYYSVLRYPAFQIEYQNRLREIRDLLFNPDQMDMMLLEHADMIDAPADGPSMVDADRAKWDYNPIFDTRYVDQERTEKGGFYLAVPSRDFRGMVAYMMQWVKDRGEWIDETLLTDTAFPYTPVIEYSGPDEWPADALRFRSTVFDDPQGSDTFGALEWRIAEISIPGAPLYDPEAPKLYEIDAAWESGELTTFQQELVLPQGVVQPWHLYRMRVRHKDSSGRWSHWSFPYQFIARPPATPTSGDIRISEIMYHPTSFDSIEGDRLEFVELYNAGSTPVDLSNWYFSDGIDYRFPLGTSLAAGDYLVLARERTTFAFIHSRQPFDTFDRALSNGGETLTLADAYERTVVSVDYTDEDPWPVEADGEGRSMVLRSMALSGSEPEHWQASAGIGGSPGRAEPQRVVVNEVVAQGVAFGAGIELHNPGDREADVSQWYVSDRLNDPRRLRLPAGTVIPAGGFLTLDAGTLQAAGVRLSVDGGDIGLFEAPGDSLRLGYTNAMSYGPTAPDQAYGRLVTSDDVVHFVPLATPSLGGANDRAKVGPVVISEIRYRPAAGYEYVQLTNTGDQPVRLYDATNGPDTLPTAQAIPWQMDGIAYLLPPGLMLAPGESLRLVADNPLDLCMEAGGAPTRLVGPYPVRLSGQQSLVLQTPLQRSDGTPVLVEMDQVNYRAGAPWPVQAADGGTTLERIDLTGFGSEPNNWRSRTDQDAGQAAASADAAASLCAFTAAPGAGEAVVEWVVQSESDVSSYRVWRVGATPDEDIPVVQALPATGTDAGSARYTVADITGSPVGAVYRLEAVGADGASRVIGYTQQRGGHQQVFLPLAARR